VRTLPCGDRAILLEVDGADEVLGLSAALRAAPPDGVEEWVAGARTVLVVFDPARTDAGRLAAAVAGLPVGPGTGAAGPVVEIPVRYDGADLAEVAERTGLGVEEVVARHSRAEYRVAFCGYAPGFGYLTGLDPALRLPRRASPRTRVPAGAVAIADVYAGVYPRQAPGGWHLLGQTDRPMWIPEADPPAVFTVGARVRFTPVPA
jgi:5-oxoprolinase (ATP-hydrolysing) subunit B